MTIPSWAEIVKTNYRVTVSQRYAESPKDMDRLAINLNDLFKEHKDWNDTYADVDHDEIVYCKLCGHEYEPMYDHEIETCANCGGGKTEYAIKILKESANENILQKL